MWKVGEINKYAGEFNLNKLVEDLKKFIQNNDEALYVCDLSQVEKQYEMWRKFMPRVFPYYAIKCNDDAFIVKTMAEIGVNFDCASKTEIQQVLDLGVSPSRIIFANPCKLVSHLEYAKSQNVNTVTVDNEFEIYKIYKHYNDSDLVIRFRCEAKDAQCPLGDKFGCDVESDASSLMLLAKSLELSVTGTSFHVGSGCNDLPAYGRAITSTKSIFKFGDMLGFRMHVLDIGGGFPGDNVEKFENIANIVNTSLDKHFPDENIQIIAEPGRYFVASAFTLLCKIYAKREIRINGKIDTKMYFLNDGVYGSFNCILYDHQKVRAQHFLKDNAKLFKTLIWGPTCDALDKIAEDINIPNMSCGDILAFPNMGAYTVPVASAFNGFLLPKMLYFKAII